MKKILTAIIALIMLLSVTLVAGCSKNDFTYTTMKNWGVVVEDSRGGFVTETDKYLYYVNGKVGSDGDNTFGAPIKGSLMVIDKDTIGTSDLKTQIAVPKLFTAQDIGAGVFISGDYVYYGTPCTDKNSSGGIAKDQMTFFRTKLDGTNSKSFFTLKSLDIDYRFAERDNQVYIIYYDVDNGEIVSYNTATGKEIIVAKTNEKTTGESLNSAELLDGANGPVVAYTTTVYSEPYIAEKAEQAGYSRATEYYNRVYTYSAGDDKIASAGVYGKVILDGETEGNAYAFKFIDGDYIFYTQKKNYESAETTYAYSFNGESKKIVNEDLLVNGTLIVSLEKAYAIDSNTSKIIQFAFDAAIPTTQRYVVSDTTEISSFITVHDQNKLYFFSSDGYIKRLYLEDADGKKAGDIVKVSGGSADTTWYQPEIIEINGVEYLFYLDISTAGANYVHYVNIDGEIKEETTGEGEEEKTTYYLDGTTLMGQMLQADLNKPVIAAINEIPNVLEYTVEEGELVWDDAKYVKAKELYDALKAKNKDAANAIDKAQINKLTYAKQAMELGEMYYKLRNFTEEDKELFRTDFKAAEDYRNALLKVSTANISGTVNMIPEDLKIYYQVANGVFNPKVD